MPDPGIDKEYTLFNLEKLYRSRPKKKGLGIYSDPNKRISPLF